MGETFYYFLGKSCFFSSLKLGKLIISPFRNQGKEISFEFSSPDTHSVSTVILLCFFFFSSLFSSPFSLFFPWIFSPGLNSEEYTALVQNKLDKICQKSKKCCYLKCKKDENTLLNTHFGEQTRSYKIVSESLTCLV